MGTHRLTMYKSQEARRSKDRVLGLLIQESSKVFLVADSRNWQLL